MQLFHFQGGVHPKEHKTHTSEKRYHHYACS